MRIEESLTAGQVQRLTGASRAKLRYWENRGIVHPLLVAHSSRTWRLYPEIEVEKIKALVALLADGYTLRGAVRRLAGTAGAAMELAPVMAGSVL